MTDLNIYLAGLRGELSEGRKRSRGPWIPVVDALESPLGFTLRADEVMPNRYSHEWMEKIVKKGQGGALMKKAHQSIMKALKDGYSIKRTRSGYDYILPDGGAIELVNHSGRVRVFWRIG